MATVFSDALTQSGSNQKKKKNVLGKIFKKGSPLLVLGIGLVLANQCFQTVPNTAQEIKPLIPNREFGHGQAF